MNEQLAAIRARRVAVESLPWWVEYREEVSAAGFVSYTPVVTSEAVDVAIVCTDADVDRDLDPNATFIAAAPADIDTLLAMVDAHAQDMAKMGEVVLGLNNRIAAAQQENETRRRLQDDAQALSVEAQRKEADAVAALVAVTAERDAQATDLAYLRSYVHALERYVPEAARRVAAGEARAQLEQQGA